MNDSYKIYIKVDDQKLTLNVTKSDTVKSIKQQIQDITKKEYSDDYELMFAYFLQSDDRTLADYNIQSESTLSYINGNTHFSTQVEPVTIFVKRSNGDNLTLNVKGNDTIENIKCQIRDLVGIPIEKQTIAFAGTTLGDRKMLGYWSVRYNFSLNGLQLTVKE